MYIGGFLGQQFHRQAGEKTSESQQDWCAYTIQKKRTIRQNERGILIHSGFKNGERSQDTVRARRREL